MHLHLVTIHAFQSPQAVPLAAACLKASLDAHPGRPVPLEVTCAEFFSGDSIEETAEAILEVGPDMVGFSLYVWNRTESAALVERLRHESPGAILFAGGPEVTADPEGVLAEAPFDFLVMGEGEITLSEALDRLLSGASLDGLAGIVRRGGTGNAVRCREPIADLGSIPSPYLSGVLDGHIPRGVLWQLSRGCPFGCEFCFDGMGERNVRRQPLERLEKELEYLVRRGAVQVVVLDSTFNLDGERAKALLRMIGRKAPDVHFHFEARAELLDAAQARLFARLKCSLQIGLQTADRKVARDAGRSQDLRVFIDRIGLLNREGVVFGFDLIYGLPGDSLDKFRETLDFALSLYPNSLAIFPLAVLHGTRLSARARVLGLNHLSRPPYTLLDSPTFPAADMEEAKRLAGACDIFYSRGKAVAWFNGIITALGLTPAGLLQGFADWLMEKEHGEIAETDLRDEEIWQLQRKFLTHLFKKRKVKGLLAAALDFVDYHYFYAAALMTPGPERLSKRVLGRTDLLNRPLALAESTRLSVFNYEIIDLLESGEPDLPRICSTLDPSGSFAAIYPSSGRIATESLAEPYYRLLENLDGSTPACRIADRLSIPREDALAFLRFAAGEGMVIFG
ncbi:MAG: radical SAM protein [Geobacteraceae bacterium]|nr:radical SAM protein [Geobacteraceae bacterium]